MTGLRIGVISDTHGLLRPEAIAALRGSDTILHAGDIGGAAILEELSALAPVLAVRGNNDRGPWAAALPERRRVELEGVRIELLHSVRELGPDPAAGGIDVVVSGHSHRPGVERRGGVLYVNPGSAGPRRFRLPVTLAQLHVEDGQAEAEIVELPLDEKR